MLVADLSMKNTQPFDRLQTAVMVDSSIASPSREHGQDVVDGVAAGNAAGASRMRRVDRHGDQTGMETRQP